MCQVTPLGDFPGGPVVKNPRANAGDTGLIPGLKDATGQLNLCPQVRSPCSAIREATAMSSLHTCQRAALSSHN